MRPLLHCSLRCGFGACQNCWKESPSIHSCKKHFTCFHCRWVDEWSHLGCSDIHCYGCIHRTMIFGLSGSSMFSFFEELSCCFPKWLN
jgi:hypothetical protein